MPPLKDGQLLFYWIDMHEEHSHPGSVFLFGKAWNEAKKAYSSCTVELTGLERTLYVAPRETATKAFEDVVAKDDKVDIEKHMMPEVLRLLKKHGIPPKMKKVTRQYHFDAPGVTHGTSEFLKVLYSYEHDELRGTGLHLHPPFPSDSPDDELSGATYAHVFGAKATAIENLIIQRKIMGPCWLLISNVKPHKSKARPFLSFTPLTI